MPCSNAPGRALSNIQALVPDPVTPVAVGVLQTQVVFGLHLLGEDVFYMTCVSMIALFGERALSLLHLPSSIQTGLE